MPLAIAIGSLLHHDDAAGRVAARLLAAMRPGLDVREVVSLAPELAEEIAAADTVLFFDASTSAGAPDLAELNPTGDAPLGHAVTAGSLLALAVALYGRAPRCALVRIPVRRLDPGEGLTRAAQAAAREAAELGDRWLASGGSTS